MRISRVSVTLIVLAGCTTADTTAPLKNVSLEGASLVVSPSCGDVIVSDLRLEGDLMCAGDGLTASGFGIKINLNGHTIAGAGTGVGIRVTSSQDITIYGGTVRGFLQGMFIAGSTGIVIKENEFRENATGLLLQASSDNSIKSNVFRENGLRAIMLRANLAGVPSTRNDIVDNLLLDNPTGIFLIAQPGNTFKGNTVSGSTVAAIDLAPAPLGASDNLFKGNLLETSAVGIRFAAGWTGNTILGNTIQANACAFQGPHLGNTFQGNMLTANVVDFCS